MTTTTSSLTMRPEAIGMKQPASPRIQAPSRRCALRRGAGSALALAALVVLLTGAPAAAELPAGVELVQRAQPAVEATPPLPPTSVFPVQLVLDDDASESAVGVAGASGARQFLWFNQFDPPPGPGFVLEEVWVLFPAGSGVAVGDAIQLAVYVDPDGDPTSGADLLATLSETVQAVDGDTFSIYPLVTPVTIEPPGDVLIGVVPRFIQTGDPVNQPAALDATASQGRSWLAVWTGDPPNDPQLPPDSLITLVDDLGPGLGGNWMIRGFGTGRPALEIPVLGGVGLVGLAVLVLLAGLVLLVRRRGAAAAGLALLLALAAPAVTEAQVVIDDFDTLQGPLTVQVPPDAVGDTDSSSVAAGAGTILGGQRDLTLTFLEGGGSGEQVNAEASGGGLVFAADAGARGSLQIAWDGDTDPSTLDPDGLGGEDLTASGTQGGFRLALEGTSVDVDLQLEVYTDADNRSRVARRMPAGSLELFIDFAELVPSPGATGPADLTDVGAVTLGMVVEEGFVIAGHFETAPPEVAAAQADFTDAGAPIGGGSVVPGETFRYRVTIDNAGGGAESVDLSNVLDAALIPGTFRTTPVLRPDQYTGFGNVALVVDGVGLPDLVANDSDPDGDPVNVVPAVDLATAQGGEVDVAADGTFAYSPPPGFTGVDTFTYTVAPVAGDPTEDAADNPVGPFTGSVSIALDRTVWFVDNSHGGPFEGTQTNPFATLADAENASGPGDIIRVRQGDGTTTGYDLGLALKPGQSLIGGGVPLVIGGQTIEPADAGRPQITHGSGGHALELASEHVIHGVDLVSADQSGMFGAAVGHVEVRETSIVDAGGAAIDIDGGDLDVELDSVSSDGSPGPGLRLANVTGTLTVSGATTITDHSGVGILVATSPGAALDFGAVTTEGAVIPMLGGGAAGGTLGVPAVAHGIDLSNGNAGATFTFDSLSVTATDGKGLFAANAGTVNINSTGATVSAEGGEAVDLSATAGQTNGVSGWTFASLSSTLSPAAGVRLDGLSDAFTVSGSTSVINAGSTGILVSSSPGLAFDFGGTAVTDTLIGGGATANGIDLATGNGGSSFQFDSLDVVTDGGFGLRTNGGSVTVPGAGNTIAATGGPGVDITGTVLAITLDVLSSTNSSGRGLTFSGASGTLTAAGGSITGVPNGNRGISINGGSLALTYDGTVTYTANDYAVRVQDTSGGGANFGAKVSSGAASLGILIRNADSSASFADLDLGTSGSPMSNLALTLELGNTGSYTFADTQIFTSGAAGFVADDGGTVEVTGGGNRITATNGRAITLQNGTTIGPNGVTFERIDASGADRGIRLTGAGSGFTVTGTGTTDGSGGTIQSITARGIEVIGTDLVEFRNMALTNAATTNGVDPTDPNGACGGLALGQNLGCNAPVHLQTVIGAVLDNVDITNSAQVGINGHTVTGFALRNSLVLDAGNQANEFSLKFRDLLGTSEITNSTVRRTVSSGTEVDQVRIQNFGGALELTVTNSVFDTNAADGPTSAFENTGFIAVGHGSADMRLVFNSSTFAHNKGPGLTVGVSDATSNATVNYIVSGGSFVDNNVGLEAIGHGVGSTITFDINGAAVDDNPAVGINVDLNSSSAAGVLLRGHVRNNTVTHTGSGDCIQVNTRGAGSAIVAITNNMLNESGFERAIDVSTQEGSGDLDVVITGNTLNMTGANPLRAMNVNSGADTGDSGTMCAKVGGTTASEKNTVNSISGGDTRVRVRRRENTVVNLEGVPGPHPQTDQATIEAYITSQNTGATGQATVGGGFGDATCQVSPFP